jgi:hypothetical protein
MSCGACGAYGILLAEVDLPAIAKIRAKLEKIESRHAEGQGDYNSPEDYPAVEKLFKPLRKALLEAGIVVPEGASLQWTGSDDDQPARCDTAAGQWILGFGLFTEPNKYPPMDPSFIAKSQWHTWVWMG